MMITRNNEIDLQLLQAKFITCDPTLEKKVWTASVASKKWCNYLGEKGGVSEAEEVYPHEEYYYIQYHGIQSLLMIENRYKTL